MKNSDVKVFELAPPATETSLIDSMKDQDMKGISIMTVEKMVAAFFKGFSKNVYEIDRVLISSGNSDSIRN